MTPNTTYFQEDDIESANLFNTSKRASELGDGISKISFVLEL